ncbi:MAG: glycoside hydrolase family 3 N-terminal domain-containing protein [Sphingomonadaceae bacterium]
MKPVIFGLSGAELTADEAAFFREADPAGYALFKRNCVDRAQLSRLTDALRSLHGRDNLAIAIDQEGGRVARMQPPEWPAFPAQAVFEALYELAPISAMEAARANAKALALMIGEVGMTVNFLPLLDVRTADTHAAIGDRSLGSDPIRVASLGRAVVDGLREGGVVGVVKHMPGQGRAVVDSHHELPVVNADEATLVGDLFAFERLNDAPMGMTGHIMFPVWDAEHCATLSPVIIREIIRGRIGFDGLLMSDDLDMKALTGNVASRAAGCVAAGCDVALKCSGAMDEMIAIADALPDITARGAERLAAAMATVVPATEFAEMADLIAHRDALLALV